MKEATEMDLRFRVVLTLLIFVVMSLLFLIIPFISRR